MLELAWHAAALATRGCGAIVLVQCVRLLNAGAANTGGVSLTQTEEDDEPNGQICQKRDIRTCVQHSESAAAVKELLGKAVNHPPRCRRVWG